MWKRTVEGRTLTFHLAGINNQNFLMRDEETGSYWQQISGRAVSGPMSGKQLELVHSDELTFGLWRGEEPLGTVLKPVARYAKEYEAKNWDVRMAKAKTVIDFPGSGMKARDLVFGIRAFGGSRAFPVMLVRGEKLVQDRVGSTPVLLVVGPDGESVRAFEARWGKDGAASDFYRLPIPAGAAAKEPVMMDAMTGSEWNFQGCAVRGKQTGTCLRPVPMLKDYWFDWRNYNPQTTIYKR